MTTEQVVDQEFICEDCGNTTPIPNEICSSCGGHMISLDAKPKKGEAAEGDEDADILGISDTEEVGDSSTVESLEDLQAKEAEEDDQPLYNTDDE